MEGGDGQTAKGKGYNVKIIHRRGDNFRINFVAKKNINMQITPMSLA